MAQQTRSGTLAARDRQTRTDTLFDRLREQFPELAVAELAEAAVGVAPLPVEHRPQDADPAVPREPPRHRA